MNSLGNTTFPRSSSPSSGVPEPRDISTLFIHSAQWSPIRGAEAQLIPSRRFRHQDTVANHNTTRSEPTANISPPDDGDDYYGGNR